MGKTASASADDAVRIGLEQSGSDLISANAESFELLEVEGV
ncbi:MAG: hypothetical protein ACI81L_001642 [Verrucomicrobiales bacterium]|jgi:hypothetical protein